MEYLVSLTNMNLLTITVGPTTCFHRKKKGYYSVTYKLNSSFINYIALKTSWQYRFKLTPNPHKSQPTLRQPKVYQNASWFVVLTWPKSLIDWKRWTNIWITLHFSIKQKSHNWEKGYNVSIHQNIPILPHSL